MWKQFWIIIIVINFVPYLEGSEKKRQYENSNNSQGGIHNILSILGESEGKKYTSSDILQAFSRTSKDNNLPTSSVSSSSFIPTSVLDQSNNNAQSPQSVNDHSQIKQLEDFQQSLGLLNALIEKINPAAKGDVNQAASILGFGSQLQQQPQQAQPTSPIAPPEKIDENTTNLQQLQLLTALLSGSGLNGLNVQQQDASASNVQAVQQQFQPVAPQQQIPAATQDSVNNAALANLLLASIGAQNAQGQQQQIPQQNFNDFTNTMSNLDTASSDQLSGLLSLLGTLGTLTGATQQPSIFNLGGQAQQQPNILASLLQPQQQQQPNIFGNIFNGQQQQQQPNLLANLGNLATLLSGAAQVQEKPRVRGIDTRFGLGYRFGENADAQVLFEIGPQLFTEPLPNEDKLSIEKKKKEALLQQASNPNRRLQMHLKDGQKISPTSNPESSIIPPTEKTKTSYKVSISKGPLSFEKNPWPAPTVLEMRSGEIYEMPTTNEPSLHQYYHKKEMNPRRNKNSQLTNYERMLMRGRNKKIPPPSKFQQQQQQQESRQQNIVRSIPQKYLSPGASFNKRNMPPLPPNLAQQQQQFHRKIQNIPPHLRRPPNNIRPNNNNGRINPFRRKNMQRKGFPQRRRNGVLIAGHTMMDNPYHQQYQHHHHMNDGNDPMHVIENEPNTHQQAEDSFFSRNAIVSNSHLRNLERQKEELLIMQQHQRLNPHQRPNNGGTMRPNDKDKNRKGAINGNILSTPNPNTKQTTTQSSNLIGTIQSMILNNFRSDEQKEDVPTLKELLKGETNKFEIEPVRPGTKVKIGGDISYEELSNLYGRKKIPTTVEPLLDHREDPKPEVFIDIDSGQVSVMRPVGELKTYSMEDMDKEPAPITDDEYQKKDKQVLSELQDKLKAHYERVKIEQIKAAAAIKKKKENISQLNLVSRYFDLIESIT